MYKKMNRTLYLCLPLLICFFAWGYDKETAKIMPFVASNKYCFECHKADDINILNDTTKTCPNICLKCHKDMNSHHKINAKISKRLSFEFFLTKRNRITCYTCHDLNIQRFDSAPWKSESLYDSVFASSKSYKTYYLTVKNNKGDLCKKCHYEVKEEK
jgi:hypothetical protein